MASHEIEEYISQICTDRLLLPGVVTECCKILKEVKIPVGWEETYQLQERHLSYKCHLELFKEFVIGKKGYLINSKRDKDEFCTALRKFISSEENMHRFGDDQMELSSENQFVDLFEKNWKIEGVVVRKTASRACVLVRSSRSRKLEEMVLPYKAGEFPGLGLQLKVGDILCVTKNRRKEAQQLLLDPEVVRHFLLEKSEIDSFLSKLCEIRHEDSVSAMLIEINQRCFAAWKYILQQQECSHSVTKQILTICNHICSSMSKTPEKMMEQFANSNFLSKVLPEFIDQIEFHPRSEIYRLLQNFMYHVLQVNPSCGQRVVALARCISTKMIAGAPDFDSAKEIGELACEFLCKLLTTVALKVPGAFSDLDSLEWQQLPLIPTPQEIHRKVKIDDLPVMREKYDSEDDYLDTNFRLIREECFYKLKKGISDFIKGNNPDPRDMMMYRVTLRGISTQGEYSPSSLSVCLNFKEVFGDQQSEEFEWRSTNWLMYGNLLCISMDGKFEHPIWVLVERKPPSQEKVVWVTFCTERNEINDAEVITRLQELGDEGQKAYMAESSTFYTAYGPAMHVLQQKATVPFKDYIVDAMPTSEPASYIIEIKGPPDWGILYEPNPRIKRKESSSPYSLLKDFATMKNCGLKEKLDDTQMAAVELALHHKVTLIQGPPGTGKSHVGVSLVRLLLSMKVPQNFGPILVVTHKNHALDHFLKDCVKMIPQDELKLVRVGSQETDLREHSLGKIAGYGTWSRHLYTLNRAMMSQLFGMQDQVRECFDKLRKINVFGVDTVIEEAKDTQITSLLTNKPNERNLANPEELEKLLKERKENPQQLSREQRDLIKRGLKAWLPGIKSFETFAHANYKKCDSAAGTQKDSNQSPTKTRKSTTYEHRGSANDEDSMNITDRSAEEKERELAMDGKIWEPDAESVCWTSTQRETEPWERHLPHLSDSKIARLENLMNGENVYDLEDDEKILLMYVMQNQYRRRAIKEFEEIAKLYAQKHREFQELKNQHHVEVLSQRHVIGMTVTGAALRANLLANIKPSVMIVEEAAEILEPQLVAVIPPSVQHLIMIGDHKQLRPTVKFNQLAKRNNLDVSMFERLITGHLPQRSLGNQCRMRNELAELLRVLEIYEKYETRGEIVRNNVSPDCVQNGLHFIEHTNPESGSYSKCNLYEAKEICSALQYLCSHGVSVTKVTVLCSYRGQVLEIKRQLENYSYLRDVEVTTIDSFQGRENDIIIVSLVRSNKRFTIGFLSSMNRLCVAISRARCALYLFGNSAVLSHSSTKGWKKLIDHMRTRQRVSRRFPYPRNDVDQQSTPTRRRYPEESVHRVCPPMNIVNKGILNVGDHTTVHCTGAQLGHFSRLVEETIAAGENRPAPERALNKAISAPPVIKGEMGHAQATQEMKVCSLDPAVRPVQKPQAERDSGEETVEMVEKPAQEGRAGTISDQKGAQDSKDVTKQPKFVSVADEGSNLQPTEGLPSDLQGHFTCAQQDRVAFEISLD